MKQAEINAIKQKAYEVAGSFPIEGVLALANYSGKTHRSGRSLFIECPECGAGSKGKPDKCSLSKNGSIFHCFGCGAKGNSGQLYALLTGCSIGEANLNLALGNGITQDEYDACIGSSVVKRKFTKDDKIYNLIQKKELEEKNVALASPDVRNLVYSSMLELKEFKLTYEAARHLISERGYTLDELSGTKEFFCYHENFEMSDLIEKIREKNPTFTQNDLVGVPGFYFKYKDSSKKSGWWRFSRPNPDSIGLTIKDGEGRILALQIRSLKEKQYYWVTSIKMNDDADKGFGCSPGTPCHVEYPKEIKNGVIMITEGKFKAHELAKQGSVAFSVQGVNNYQHLLGEIGRTLRSKKMKSLMSESIKKKKPKFRIYLMFDADMLFNLQVFKAAKNLCGELMAHYPSAILSIMIWKQEYGKGFDDLKQKNTDWKSKLLEKNPEELISFIENKIKEVKDVSFKNYSWKKIYSTQELKKEFSDTLYKESWREFDKVS